MRVVNKNVYMKIIDRIIGRKSEMEWRAWSRVKKPRGGVGGSGYWPLDIVVDL